VRLQKINAAQLIKKFLYAYGANFTVTLHPVFFLPRGHVSSDILIKFIYAYIIFPILFFLI